MANEGKQFEQSVETSCSEQGLFYFRVRDVNPMAIKKGQSVPKNKYDAIIYRKNYLFPVELKSTKSTRISMSESMIKAYQIKSLKEAATYEGVIAGFLFNYRLPENRVFFIHIDEFLKYQNIAENQIKDHEYISKVNKASVPIGICEEIGVEVKCLKKVKHYRFFINALIDELIEKYGYREVLNDKKINAN